MVHRAHRASAYRQTTPKPSKLLQLPRYAAPPFSAEFVVPLTPKSAGKGWRRCDNIWRDPNRTCNSRYTGYGQEYAAPFYKYVEHHSGTRSRLGDPTAGAPGGDTSCRWRVNRPLGGEWQADLDAEHVEPAAGWECRWAPPYEGRIGPAPQPTRRLCRGRAV